LHEKKLVFGLGNELPGNKAPSEIRIIAVEAKNLYNLGEGLTQEIQELFPVAEIKGKEMLRK